MDSGGVSVSDGGMVEARKVGSAAGADGDEGVLDESHVLSLVF